ncbi:hypothetical protein EON64_14240 [archaeon]|nr:MAG: hypothetical protein EON64_14240 [archaeon]
MAKKSPVVRQRGGKPSKEEKKVPNAREMRQIVRSVQNESESSSEEEEQFSDEEDDSEEEDEEFEQQSSSGESSGAYATASEDEGEPDDVLDKSAEAQLRNLEKQSRSWSLKDSNRLRLSAREGALDLDDLSSDDEAGARNTIGRVPLHWYDAFDHIGYTKEGEKIAKSALKDKLDLALEAKDEPNTYRVYDVYNDREVCVYVYVPLYCAYYQSTCLTTRSR